MDIYLIDGNSYLYRSYYAIQGLTDPSGRPTGAVYGFTKMLMKLIEDKKPGAIVVSFDTPHPTGRHELFEDYKANRAETPDDLIAQMPIVKDVVRAMNIPVFEAPGYEADDVLATLAEHGVRMGMNAYIVSGDKDMLQLVTDRLRVYDPSKEMVYGPAEVMERFGLPPERVIEYMALVGDAADNIPGVKGIGDKTARALLSRFESLEDMMANTGLIENARQRKMIEEGGDAIRLSRQLAEIDRKVPLEFRDDDLLAKEPDWAALSGMFRELGFTSMLAMIPSNTKADFSFECIVDEARLEDALGAIGGLVALDTETTGLDTLSDRIVGFSFCSEGRPPAYVPLAHTTGEAQVDKARALNAFGRVCADEGIAKAGHNLKFDIMMLQSEGVEVRGKLYDTMIADYLLNPMRADHSLETVGLQEAGRAKTPYREVAGKGGFEDVPLERAAPYAAEDAELALLLKDSLFKRLEDEGLERLYFDIEEPLIRVLAEMERAGVRIDTGMLGDIGVELDRELESILKRIYFHAGQEFNPNSPKQLAKVLFEDLGLKPGKKKKTGYSTDQSVLEDLSLEHALPAEVLSWRQLAKLKGTYIDALPRLVNPNTGRLHTSFNQTVTATGRLSSSDPNLQNIPVRGDWGERIRKCFVASEGSVLISADYSQIELRVLAHMSLDETLVEAFESGLDIHSRTASEIFGVGLEGVTQDMRRVAKTVNFGVIYGMSSFGLAGSLGIPRWQAEKYIKQYFERHPGVSAFVEGVIKEATSTGYVSTMFGRRRPVPELKSKNRNTRQLGERFAVNSPIQGTAADIIKIAMIKIHREIAEQGLRGRMILQVHDELLFESPLDERDRMLELVERGMCGAASLRVPLKVEIGAASNWAGAH